MSGPNPALAERQEQILGELAEWLHAGAREAQRRLLEAETTEEFATLTGSLAKLARGVRQSILVQRKLESDRLAAEKKAEVEARPPSEFVPRHIKRVRVRTAVARHLQHELAEECEDIDLFWDDMNARLDELEGAADFLDTPTDTLIAQLCQDLGFEPPEPPPPLIPAVLPCEAGEVARPEGAGRRGRAGTQADSPDVPAPPPAAPRRNGADHPSTPNTS